MADVKGDVSGLAMAGTSNENTQQRVALIGDLLWGTNKRQGMVETLAKQAAARTVGTQLGRQILRGVLGGILGRR